MGLPSGAIELKNSGSGLTVMGTVALGESSNSHAWPVTDHPPFFVVEPIDRRRSSIRFDADLACFFHDLLPLLGREIVT